MSEVLDRKGFFLLNHAFLRLCLLGIKHETHVSTFGGSP